MNNSKSILRILTANLFLLALLTQSIHQVEHFTHRHIEEQQFHEHENCHHAGHITTTNHCEFCDYTHSPTVELTIEFLDVPVLLSKINDTINVELHQHFVSQYIIHKKLRGPPLYA